jgi:membrane fusion protein (multidrug efflux system)
MYACVVELINATQNTLFHNKPRSHMPLLLSRFAVTTVLLSSLFIVGCSQSECTDGMTPGAMPPPQVSVMELTLLQVPIIETLPARISASHQSLVRPQIDGVIIERLFTQGALVTEGQPLFQIDDKRYSALLNSAKADLVAAKANHKALIARQNRYKDLLANKAVSPQEYDDVVAQQEQAEAAINVAEAAVSLAQVNLDYTRVESPISGVISRSYYTVGSLVTTNQVNELATITALDPIYIDIQQSSTQSYTLRQALQTQKTLSVNLKIATAMGEKLYPHQGNLQFSEVVVSESTGTVTLRAEIDNPDGLLMPGMLVTAEVVMGTQSGFLVPQRATMRQPDGSLMVYVVNSSNTVEVRPISNERIYGDGYVIASGIEAGDKILITGHMKVGPGATVIPSIWQEG